MREPGRLGYFTVTQNIATGLRRTTAATMVEETLAYYAFPWEHRRRIRTKDPLKRILRDAVARKLMIALWRYSRWVVVPEGAGPIGGGRSMLGWGTSKN